MPPILDAAIGTFFVFMLFSIAVTALNEVVLSFFDKRADFLRLGLGELLSDPQKGRMEGFVTKLAKYSANSNGWLALWAGASFVLVASTGAFLEAFLTGGLVAGLLALLRLLLARVAPPPPPTAAGSAITVDAVFQHPLVFSLSKGETDPSYIGSKAFAKALIDMLVPAIAGAAITSPPTQGAIRAAILALPAGTPGEQKLQQSLAALLRAANYNVAKFEAAIEDWFNSSMDRVTGWYKRHAQTWLICLALILAVVCNVDSIRIVQELANNPNLAKSVAAQAEGYVKANLPLTEPTEVEAALQKKREALAQAEAALAALVKPEADARRALLAAQDETAKTKAAADLAAAVAGIDPKQREAAEEALKTAQLDISLPLSLATLNTLREQKEANIQKARADLAAASQTGGTGKIQEATQKLNEAIGFDVAMAQFTNDLKALSATGIPMGWDDKTHARFGIMKTAAPSPTQPDVTELCWTQRLTTWFLRPYTWLESHFHRPQHWKWGVLFPALCGWGLTAIAASLGAPFWFDLLQRIMNLRANGRSPDEKALGTKKGT